MSGGARGGCASCAWLYPTHARERFAGASLRRWRASPAVIVQTDALPAEHASVVICQTTSECSDAPDFRVTIEPNERNGLRVRSQVMVDKQVTIRRERIGRQVGRLDDKDIAGINIALAFVMGLAD